MPQQENSLAAEDACHGGRDHFVADAAPADGLAEQRRQEIPGEKERDDGREKRPDPAPLIELRFPFGKRVADGDGADGAFDRG